MISNAENHKDLLRELERLKRENEELRQLEEIRNDLVHLIVHDMNNPLTTIVGNLELAMMLKPTLSKGQMDSLRLARASADRLMRMVRNLLDIDWMEDGQPQLKLEPVAIDSLVEAVRDDLQIDLTRPGLSVELDVEPATVPVDRQMMTQVLANVLDSALRYSGSDDTVIIKGRVVLTCGMQERAYVLSVSDNGPSVPPEYADALFDKARQVEIREAGIARGAGFGLAFCRLAARAHGGDIWLETNGNGANRGRTISLRLPLVPSEG